MSDVSVVQVQSLSAELDKPQLWSFDSHDIVQYPVSCRIAPYLMNVILQLGP